MSTPAETIFSRIIRREVPARIEHEDDLCLAFHDVAPQAPVHLLVIPKRPIPSLAESVESDEPLLGHLVGVAAALARKLGLSTGYRLVVNCGRDGGQTVGHLHVHLLGGRPLDWPPG
jgi:histidine triad (HIT) family protein